MSKDEQGVEDSNRETRQAWRMLALQVKLEMAIHDFDLLVERAQTLSLYVFFLCSLPRRREEDEGSATPIALTILG